MLPRSVIRPLPSTVIPVMRNGLPWDEADGRRGTAAAWAPSALGPVAVYDAADPDIVLVGSEIEQVPDLYNSGATIAAPAAGNRLELVNNVINGQPVMRIATGRYLRAAVFTWGGVVTDFTIWWVSAVPTAATIRYVFDYFGGSAAAQRILVFSSTTDFVNAQCAGSGGATSVSTSTTIAARLWVYRRSGNSQFLYMGSTQQDTDANTHVGQTDASPLTIGASNAGATSLLGDLGQIGFVKRAITVGVGSELASLHSYAQTRWAVP